MFFSASLSINITSVSDNGVELSPSPSVGLSVCVCLSVRKMYCGKTADRIQTLFWGEFGVSHCNQWGLCCVVARELRALPKLLWDDLFSSLNASNKLVTNMFAADCCYCHIGGLGDGC